ncbi:hypothetical protein DFR70_11143 [Nocardia tenerifensis]|uniref:Uncharacterized protein n=1 Tax=Nocardia tenerifensis TaxID=228006 RepID=A0A318JYW9_9NOCA|nr:hypothetical protein [Nocardia tenerifensis]PXX59661.1 hypothetical protein DFR70_11143 [Nocardia tenerifensis]
MDDAVVSVVPTDSIADAIPPPPRFDEPGTGLSGADAAAFAYTSDHLVRHLFDVGLQLHTLKVVLDQPHTTVDAARAVSDAVGAVLDDLDLLIRDTGLAVLALTPNTRDGQTPQRRKRHR